MTLLKHVQHSDEAQRFMGPRLTAFHVTTTAEAHHEGRKHVEEVALAAAAKH